MSLLQIDFIQSVALPEPRRGPARGGEFAFKDAEPEGVVIGSQLVDFAADMPSAQREAVSNALLLAQLAANKAVGADQRDTRSWYASYRNTLQRIGWHGDATEFQQQALSADGALVHKEILPLVTAFLGPAASAASIVVRMLQSLSAMDEGKPWITLFQDDSQTLTGAQFQLSRATQAAMGDPEVALLAIDIEASRRITQVLFFKLTREATRLEKSTSTLAIGSGLLQSISRSLRDKVHVHVADNVAAIAI